MLIDLCAGYGSLRKAAELEGYQYVAVDIRQVEVEVAATSKEVETQKVSWGAAISIRSASILEATEDYLIHQCNCHSTSAAGLASAIFARYPYADTYSDRGEATQPGTISVHDGDRSVVNLYAQRYPGRAGHGDDSEEQRQVWFRDGLAAVGQVAGLNSVAMPYGIGCGLAGGSWPVYHDMIRDFATAHPHLQVTLYHLK